MRREKILVVDDDPDILDVLSLTLNEYYDVILAHDGEEGLRIARAQTPDLIIIDYKMPKLDGRQVCLALKKDILLQHIPTIMLTGKGEIADKVSGIGAGADDYIVKPFEPQELLARIKMILRRTQRDLEADPLTRLPGNVSILNELLFRLESKELFAVSYLDLDKFKSYNDKYGFLHGDEVIKETAGIILKAVQQMGNLEDFVGHIGGDDFVFISTPERVDNICGQIISDFEAAVPNFYNAEDRKKGCIIGKDRQGKEQKIPLLSISMGVVTNENRQINHVAEIGEIGAELKQYAKSLERSNYIKDKRKSDEATN